MGYQTGGDGRVKTEEMKSECDDLGEDIRGGGGAGARAPGAKAGRSPSIAGGLEPCAGEGGRAGSPRAS